MISQTSIVILGLGLTGFSALIYRLFGTNVGRRWLNRIIDWVTEKRYNCSEPKQLAKRGLEILEQDRTEVSNAVPSRQEGGTLRSDDKEFNVVIEHLEELNTSNFEPVSTDDDIERLERVEAGHNGVIAAERGVPRGMQEHIHAIMEDGSRKIVLGPGYAQTLRKGIETEERKRRRQFEKRVEDGIKGSVILIGVVGVGFVVYGSL